MSLAGIALLACLAADPVPASSEAPVAVGTPSKPKKDLPRIFVTDLTPQGVTPEQAYAVRDAVVAALVAQGLFDVVSTRDVQTLLSIERQKQLLGACADESQCASDASSLLQARFVLSGTLSKLGDAVQLQLQGLDTQKSQPVGRATRIARSLDALRELVPYAAAESVGAPLPPPPSKVPSVLLMSVGGATLLAGGFVGLQALATESALNAELCPSGAVEGQRCDGRNLSPRDFYVAQQRDLGVRKGVAIGLLAGGAVLGALGIWLFPPDVARPRFAVRLVPQANGVGLAGVLP